MSVEVVIRCLTCQARYNVTKYPAGLRVKCKKCGQTLVVPPTAANVSHLAEEEQQVAGTMMFDASSLASTLPPTAQKPTVDAVIHQPEPSSDFPDFPSADPEPAAPSAPPFVPEPDPFAAPEPATEEPAEEEAEPSESAEEEEEEAKPEKKPSRFSRDKKGGKSAGASRSDSGAGKSAIKDRKPFGLRKGKDKEEDPLADVESPDEEGAEKGKIGKSKFGRDKKGKGGKGKSDRRERKGRRDSGDDDAPKSKKKLFIIIAALLIVGLGAGAYFMFLAGPKPDVLAKEINSKFYPDKETMAKLTLLGTLTKQNEKFEMANGKFKLSFELLGDDKLKAAIANKDLEIAAAVSESLKKSETYNKHKDLCESLSGVGGDKGIWTVTINCDPKKLSALLKSEADLKLARKDFAAALESFEKTLKEKSEPVDPDEQEEATSGTDEKKPEGDGKEEKKEGEDSKPADDNAKPEDSKKEEKPDATDEKKSDDEKKDGEETSSADGNGAATPEEVVNRVFEAYEKNNRNLLVTCVPKEYREFYGLAFDYSMACDTLKKNHR